jgi:hypothetical protein
LGHLPATVQTPVVALGERPQNMSGEVRLVMGLLSMTVRVHFVTWSAVPTHRSCQVECAETDAAAARRTIADFILLVFLTGTRDLVWRTIVRSEGDVESKNSGAKRSIYRGLATHDAL